MKNFYATIWRRTWRQQLRLIALSAAIAAIAAVPIHYQKQIINAMTVGGDFGRIAFLGAMMAAFVGLSLLLKAVLRYRIGVLGERVIKVIRSGLIERVVAVPTDDRRTEKGTLSNIVSSESEAVGNFVGSAIADPLLQLGTLLSVLVYILFTTPGLGVIIICITAPQAVVVVLTQPRINTLVRARVKILRSSINLFVSSNFGPEIKQILNDFLQIFEIRRRIHIWKILTKSGSGVLNGMGLIFILVYGGWLVTEGNADVGSVVAATVALGRVQAPWRDLTNYFRTASVVVIQFQLIEDVFDQMPTADVDMM